MNRPSTAIVASTLFAISLLAATKAPSSAGDQGYFGMAFRATTPGALVTHVRPDGPAGIAGLQAGDLIVSVEGEALRGKEHEEVHEILGGFEVGDEVLLEVVREDRLLPVTVVLGPVTSVADAEVRDRLHARIEEDRALGQLIALAERSRVFVLRRTDGGEIQVRAKADDARWELVHPKLAEMLDRALKGRVAALEPGQTLEVEGILGENRVALKALSPDP